MKKKLNIAIIGSGFMGRAHSNGWRQLNKFFAVDYEIVLKVVADCNKEKLEAFAEQWGYEEICTDWHELLERDDIDVIDILTPTYEHKEMAIAAMKAGKHVICEKPCAISYEDAAQMAKVQEECNVVTYLNHNYRKVPAIMLAKRMIDEGKLGTIYHWRGSYLQDWIMDEKFPLTWHLKKDKAGAGPLFDLSSHALDLARFLIGEPKSVIAMNKTFINKRPFPGDNAATFSAGTGIKNAKMGDVTVEDAAFMVLEFENGALGNIDSTRFAGGRKNYNCFEVYGSKGSLCFNLERLNELEYYDCTEDTDTKGYKTIIVQEGTHPYAGAWWPAGHSIGYEQTFVHAFYEFVRAIEGKTKAAPDFVEGAKIMHILECARESSEKGMRIEI
ncbi:MAG: Gfo/Idh/MocA family protein [Velocimicrobium sp.]